MEPNEDQYRQMAAFRQQLRRFLYFSEQAAASVGLTGTQYQLLLVIRAWDGNPGPTIGEVAESLLLRPHSAGELIDRAEAAGIVCRVADGRDRRLVRVQLTDKGHAAVTDLAGRHLEHLKVAGPLIDALSTFAEHSEL